MYYKPDLIREFNNWLDEAYSPVNIAGLTYCASYVLKTVDPMTYNEIFNNWLDAQGIDIDKIEGE